MDTSNAYPKYYRKDGRCLKRKTDTTGTEVRVPDDPKNHFPLMMSEVIYPDKERLDEDIAGLEPVNDKIFEDYVYAFIRGVEMNVSQPMTQLQIKRELEKNRGIGR
jgi:hypothetical protein